MTRTRTEVLRAVVEPARAPRAETLDVAGSAGVGPRGGAGQGGSGGAGVHLGNGSWDFTGDVKELTPNTFPISCDHLDFTVVIDGQTMTLGRNGEQSSVPVQIADGEYVATDVELPKGTACYVSQLHAKVLRLRGIDSDGDGEADQLETSATLDASAIQGDIGVNGMLSANLTAVPDRTSPTLIISDRAQNPLDGAYASASEPLDPTTSLKLTGTSALPLPSDQAPDAPPGSPLISFRLQSVLPFGGTWQVTGVGKDFAGHSLLAGNSITTVPDPGTQAQDGFESTLHAVGAGDASLIASYGTIAALSGAHSLWLPPDSSLTFHLQRAGAENKLHFAARAFGQSAYFGKPASAGVVGGSKIVELTHATPASSDSIATGDAKLPWATPVVSFDAVLDEPGSDVVLRIAEQYCNGFCPPGTAWMIDDLRLE